MGSTPKKNCSDSAVCPWKVSTDDKPGDELFQNKTMQDGYASVFLALKSEFPLEMEYLRAFVNMSLAKDVLIIQGVFKVELII